MLTDTIRKNVMANTGDNHSKNHSKNSRQSKIQHNVEVIQLIANTLSEINRIEKHTPIKFPTETKKNMITYAIIEKEICVDSGVEKMIIAVL